MAKEEGTVPDMKKFVLVADITFYAKDIDDACQRLSEHFRQVSENLDSNNLIEEGLISLHVEDEQVRLSDA